MKKTIKILCKKTNRKRKRTIEDDFFFLGCAVLACAAAAAAVLHIWPGLRQVLRLPPCLFHLITGYYCPGCGGTRAVRALFKGQLLKSAYYHPIVPYAAAVCTAFMATQAAERLSRGKYACGMRYRSCYVWTAAAIIAVNFIIKNALHHFCGFML